MIDFTKCINFNKVDEIIKKAQAGDPEAIKVLEIIKKIK